MDNNTPRFGFSSNVPYGNYPDDNYPEKLGKDEGEQDSSGDSSFDSGEVSSRVQGVEGRGRSDRARFIASGGSIISGSSLIPGGGGSIISLPEAEKEENRRERFSLLRRAPRPVPLSLVLSILFPWISLFGAFFFSFGMIFVWVFISPFALYEDFQLHFGERGVSKGVVRDYSSANLEINEEPVYRVVFEYKGSDGITYTANSQTFDTFRVGQEIMVEYLKSNPGVARVEGIRKTKGGIGFLFVLLFPGVGFLLMFGSFMSGLKTVKLLREGELTWAKVTKVEHTGVQINSVPEVKVSFRYKDHYGREFTGSCKTLERHRICDEEEEPALYLPGKSRSAVVIDAISTPVGVLPSGDWAANKSLVPILTALGVFSLFFVHVLVFIYLLFAR